MKYLALFDWAGNTEHQAFPTKEELDAFVLQVRNSPHNTTVVTAEVINVYKKETAENGKTN